MKFMKHTFILGVIKCCNSLSNILHNTHVWVHEFANKIAGRNK